MIVTTGVKPEEADVARAKALAAELGGRYVPRRSETLTGLRRKHGADRLLSVGAEGLRLYVGSEPPLFFHPSMAFVRVKRLRSGERDPLVEISGCKPGDRVLDCTAGLASDALVFSYAAGGEGGVTALESEPALHAVVREGLRTYETGLPDVDAALRRIEAVRADHAAYLASLPENSVDIVYFDPMFRMPLHESSGLEPLRAVANPAPLTPHAIEEACRVARRIVMLKENRDSGEFDRLGFEWVMPKKTSKIAYGVIRI